MVVDVLSGAVTIRSTVEKEVTVEAGKEYIYLGDGSQGIKTVIPNDIPDSLPIQTFLEPNNWSQDVFPLIEKFQAALQQVIYNSLSPTAQEFLKAHNQCRAKFKVQPLRWSNELASYAQNWADKLSKSGGLDEHQLENRYGENLANDSSPSDAVNAWCSEEKDYDYTTNTCRDSSMSCYHYTQVVWRNTKEVGCGVAPLKNGNKVFVCNYNPPGNFDGEKPY